MKEESPLDLSYVKGVKKRKKKREGRAHTRKVIPHTYPPPRPIFLFSFSCFHFYFGFVCLLGGSFLGCKRSSTCSLPDEPSSFVIYGHNIHDSRVCERYRIYGIGK